MCNRLPSLLFWYLTIAFPGNAQETVIRYFHPLLSPAITDRASGVQGAIRALVVGVGHYQADGFGARPYARRDAEAFAAFLKTPAGGSATDNDLVLLTNEAATLAQVSENLHALVEDLRQGDKLVVYFALQGQINGRGETRLLFYDSPPAPTDAGFLALSRLCALLGETALRRGARVLFIAEIEPYHSSPKNRNDWRGPEEYGGLFRVKFTQNTTEPDGDAPEGETFGNILLKGLLGLADLDKDQRVHVPELLRYLEGAAPTGACAFLAFSDKNDWLCKAGEFIREKLAGYDAQALSPILQLEVQPFEAFISRQNDAGARRLYEDFILNIRLGRLLDPPGRCAKSLLDSLLQVKTLEPIHKNLQRRLAVAYLDESQQALNAYLQTSVKELNRRRKDREPYKFYPEYLKQSIEILGPRHFMLPLLEAKQRYFEGLVLRLEFDYSGDPALLPTALEKQRQAIALEPEAAFVYNEIGVVCMRSNQLDTAAQNFRLAAEIAPSWGIPHANLGVVRMRQGLIEQAIDEAVAAVGLNAWNPGMYVVLGEICQSKPDLNAAESAYRRALRLDPDFPDAHYDLACLYSLRGQHEAALESLRLALKNGFNRPGHLLADPDLLALRRTNAFRALFAAYFPDFKKE